MSTVESTWSLLDSRLRVATHQCWLSRVMYRVWMGEWP